MSKVENAVQWAINIANDPRHGYSQDNRWGPDYDCSSLVISAYRQAGISVGGSNTSTMYSGFTGSDFTDVTGLVSCSSASGMIRGDVLLAPGRHTAIYTGEGRLVEASSDEYGGRHGVNQGDQTGQEIWEHSYYNFPWTCVLRYKEAGIGWQQDSTGYYYKYGQGDAEYFKDGFELIDGEYYYFNERGYALQSQFKLHRDGRWYYLKADRKMAKGWQYVDGHYYYLNTTPKADLPLGAMVEGWRQVAGEWYFLHTASTAAGKPVGSMAIEWIKDSNNHYFFRNSSEAGNDNKPLGSMVLGWKTLGGSRFYFNPDSAKGSVGAMLKEQWLYDGTDWYWFKDSGHMAVDWIQYNGKYFYLRNAAEAARDGKPTGSLTVGWKYLGGSYFYFNTDASRGSIGYMLEEEWLSYDKSMFWLKKGGYMAINETLTIGGREYTFNHTGRMVE